MNISEGHQKDILKDCIAILIALKEDFFVCKTNIDNPNYLSLELQSSIGLKRFIEIEMDKTPYMYFHCTLPYDLVSATIVENVLLNYLTRSDMDVYEKMHKLIFKHYNITEETFKLIIKPFPK